MSLPRPPERCPTCQERLVTTGLGCPACGTGVTGGWSPCACPYCRLGPAQQEILRVFLESRGNVRELERFLGVSYPTARARLDEVVHALGFQEVLPPAATRRERLEVLRAVADRGIDVDQALRDLGEGPARGPGRPSV